MTTVEVFAPAKINLTLHVTGRRPDGYHELDSLVTFAPVGDRLWISDAEVSAITVEGPEAAGVPADMDNLALRAAVTVMGARGVALTLDKRLPVASGIGGGSSDAAAAVRGALVLLEGDAHTRLAAGPDILRETRFRPLLDIGADLSMCLLPRPLRAEGIGEEIGFVPLPPLPAVLVNPRVSVSTPDVFRRISRRDNSPMPEMLPRFPDIAAAIDWLTGQRNDLQEAARGIAPEIDAVQTALAATDGCGLARMSGSGATCFGLYQDEHTARIAAAQLSLKHPGWWVVEALLGDQTVNALPVS